MVSSPRDVAETEGAPSPALAAARHLISRMKLYPASDSASDPLVSALHRACAAAVLNMKHSIGDDGCNALLSRAFAGTEAAHPLAAKLRDSTAFITSRERLSAAVVAHGGTAVEAAVEHLLAGLIAILARLIGDEMAIRVIDRDAIPPANGPAGTA
jgi:hypothetical protein